MTVTNPLEAIKNLVGNVEGFRMGLTPSSLHYWNDSTQVTVCVYLAVYKVVVGGATHYISEERIVSFIRETLGVQA